MRYYVGDKNIPWWIQVLKDEGLILNIKEDFITATKDFPQLSGLIYKDALLDTNKHYLYNGDYLELNEKTGAVTIGRTDWENMLNLIFFRNHPFYKKFSLKRMEQDYVE